METKDRVRIAQTTLTCGVCRKPIKIGKPYAWVQVKRRHPERGEIIHLLRAHPQCGEVVKEDDNQSKEER